MDNIVNISDYNQLLKALLGEIEIEKFIVMCNKRGWINDEETMKAFKNILNTVKGLINHVEKDIELAYEENRINNNASKEEIDELKRLLNKADENREGLKAEDVL